MSGRIGGSITVEAGGLASAPATEAVAFLEGLWMWVLVNGARGEGV